ncbi:unnamed protein product [Heligmosomoides polygyrus]|uniref:Uncharacterized protein n=1 Tax=Heligmosomoides polygyrus TaxID=6339 RepID=A0A183FZY5_HELPZ|nr:unnamed protein product [Heligmosomoides polygyrus]
MQVKPLDGDRIHSERPEEEVPVPQRQNGRKVYSTVLENQADDDNKSTSEQALRPLENGIFLICYRATAIRFFTQSTRGQQE